MRARPVPTLAVLLLLVPAAAAQEPAPAARLPEIRVTAPAPVGTLLDLATPGRVDRLGEEEIRGARSSALPDVLERLPGVTLQNEQGSRFQPSLSLRGFGVSSVTGLPQGFSVFLDGVRLNEPTVEEVNFDLIPLEDVERIEVIRGPSVLFGRNTLGGAINLVTRRGREPREIVPEVAAGSFGRRDLRLRLGGAARPLDWAFSLTDSRDDGYRDFTGGRTSRAFGKVGLDLGGTDLTLSYQYANNHVGQAGSLPESEARRHPRRSFSPDFFAPELHMAILSGEHRLDERLTVAVNAFVRALDAEQFNVNVIAPNSRLVSRTLSTGGTLQATHDGRSRRGAARSTRISPTRRTRWACTPRTG